MNPELLIIGIDPGTTLGYAIINTEGQLIKIDSSKNFSLSLLISKTIDLGKIIAVGTDKKKIPSFIKDFSIKIGAKIINPKEDLKVEEKKELTSNIKTRDYHQMDALASALFAYKELTPLLKKIQDYVECNKKENKKNKIIELVITKELSIREAMGLIEKPETEENMIVKKVIEEKKFSESDFLRVYSKSKMLERENELLKKQRNHLLDEIKDIKEGYSHVLEKISKFKIDEKSKELINFKEKRIHFFDKEIKNKNDKINQLQNETNKLVYLLSNLNSNYLAKKMDNLGYSEFERKNQLLNIKEKDILMVNDPNISNNRVIEQIKDKVHIIMHKKEINNKTKSLPFIFINGKGLKIIESKYFALVNKKDLDKEINQIDILDKIIKDYKKGRIKTPL